MDTTTPLMVLIAVVGLGLAIWALVDLWRSPNTVLAKVWWTFGIIIIPIIIATAYLLTRPSGKLQQQAYELHDDPNPSEIKHNRDEREPFKKPE